MGDKYSIGSDNFGNWTLFYDGFHIEYIGKKLSNVQNFIKKKVVEYNTKLREKKLERIFKTAKNLELPTFNKDFCNKKILISAINDSVKHRNNNQYLPLPIDIGNYRIINNLSEKEITAAIKTFKKQ
jgi:3-dehydroquinate synthase